MKNRKSFEENFREKFYYGYNNREEILEAIIYFANHEIHQNKSKDKTYSLGKEYTMCKEPFWKENIKRATQLYTQFYRFVDLNDIPSPRKKDPSYYFSYEMGMTQEDLEDYIEKEMIKMVKEEKMYISASGIYLYREWENKFDAFFQVEYELLCILENLEKKDKLEYYNKWITAKWNRALNSSVKDGEFEIIDKVYKAFQERKAKIMNLNFRDIP